MVIMWGWLMYGDYGDGDYDNHDCDYYGDWLRLHCNNHYMFLDSSIATTSARNWWKRWVETWNGKMKTLKREMEIVVF